MIELQGKKLTQIKAILNELKDYVIVVGSVAEGTDNDHSDIDFYVKSKNEEILDKEVEANNYSFDGIEDTYIDQVIKILEEYEVEWESLFTSYITTENLPIQLEFSPVYSITDKQKSKVNVYDVELQSYVDK